MVRDRLSSEECVSTARSSGTHIMNPDLADEIHTMSDHVVRSEDANEQLDWIFARAERSGRSESSLESLILAQDERWRRA